MQEPPRPANEPDRLQALRELLILDTPPEERFDRLTAFAAQEGASAPALPTVEKRSAAPHAKRASRRQCGNLYDVKQRQPERAAVRLCDYHPMLSRVSANG